MEADEHERKYMNLDGPVRFRDRPRRRKLVAEIAGVGLLLAAMFAFGLDLPLVAFMALVGAIGVGVGSTMSGYRVVLTDRSLHLQFGLRTHRIPLASVEEVTAAPGALPSAAEDGGARTLEGAVQRYGAPGLRESVRIRWRQGPRTKTTVVGTERAAELAERVAEARRRVARSLKRVEAVPFRSPDRA